MPKSFSSKLSHALGLLNEEPPAGSGTPVNQAGMAGPGQANGPMAASQQNRIDVKKQKDKQKNSAGQNQANQLYQKYQQAKRELDDAEKAASAKQDVALFNAAASARKRMEETYQAYQLEQQKALGQPANPDGNGLPPEAAV